MSGKDVGEYSFISPTFDNSFGRIRYSRVGDTIVGKREEKKEETAGGRGAAEKKEVIVEKVGDVVKRYNPIKKIHEEMKVASISGNITKYSRSVK
jgi:hypothetical protein